MDREVDVQRLPGVSQVLLEVLVEVLADADVLEHPLQLAGVLEAARLLQLGDHARLGVVAGGHVLHQPLGQHLAVELLEHVLVLDVLEDDHDLVDANTIPIVCNTILAGMEDTVAGVVRIDEREPGVWYGSRLGVAKDFRRLRHVSPGVAVRNLQPCYHALGALGAGLIYKAVSTANAIGCHEFLATVQHQNTRFFQRLHWEPLEEISLHGLKHIKMRADLNRYQPAARVA